MLLRDDNSLDDTVLKANDWVMVDSLVEKSNRGDSKMKQLVMDVKDEYNLDKTDDVSKDWVIRDSLVEKSDKDDVKVEQLVIVLKDDSILEIG